MHYKKVGVLFLALLSRKTHGNSDLAFDVFVHVKLFEGPEGVASIPFLSQIFLKIPVPIIRNPSVSD